MANIRFRSIEGYETFKTKCNFFRCEEEYPGWTGNEKYIILLICSFRGGQETIAHYLYALSYYIIVATGGGCIERTEISFISFR